MNFKDYSLGPDSGAVYPEHVKKYLTKYASDGWTLETNYAGKITNAVVVPAIGELDNLLKLLSSLADCDNKYFTSTLVIFVINNTSFHDDEIKTNNSNSINFLRSIITKNFDASTNKIIRSGLNIGLIDASGPGKEMPEKDGGVGLARKIGMDISLSVFDYASPEKKIIICLDADCTVEKNYLTGIIEDFNEKNLSAAAVQFQHSESNETEIEKAIICYEIFLHYYVLGLKYANSPFAFHTIGSTMVCDYESYVKIGGMNKKKAAEDFYFLEKLAKITRIDKIDKTVVHPAPRSSWRVPFGTGQRINRYLSKSHEEYYLYNPRSFDVLKKWIDIFYADENLTGREYLERAKAIDINLYGFLELQKFAADWDKIINNSSSKIQIQKQKSLWFDGFRTLKLIHHIRDNGYPLSNMFDALDEMFSMFKVSLPERNGITIPEISIQKEYLEILRANT